MIESRQNKLIKDIRRLRLGKGERGKGEHGKRKGSKDDRALLEGPHLVAEALAAGIELETVLATPDFLASTSNELVRSLRRAPLEVAPGLLAEIADTDSPRGILAVARLPRQGCEELPQRPNGIYVYAVGVQDPGNLGALARTAEATGIAALAIAPTGAHPNHPRALRASAGSLLRLPVAIDVEFEQLVGRLTPLGATWLALSPRAGASIYDGVPPPPLVLAIGAERGLPSAIERHCDQALTVPMAAPVESLNTAVAAAVALFEMRRQIGPVG